MIEVDVLRKIKEIELILCDDWLDFRSKRERVFWLIFKFAGWVIEWALVLFVEIGNSEGGVGLRCVGIIYLVLDIIKLRF